MKTLKKNLKTHTNTPAEEKLYEETMLSELSESSKVFREHLLRMFSRLLPMSIYGAANVPDLNAKATLYGRISAGPLVYWAVMADAKHMHFFGCPGQSDGLPRNGTETWGEYLLVPTETGDLGIAHVADVEGNPVADPGLIPLVTSMQVVGIASGQAPQERV